MGLSFPVNCGCWCLPPSALRRGHGASTYMRRVNLRHPLFELLDGWVPPTASHAREQLCISELSVMVLVRQCTRLAGRKQQTCTHAGLASLQRTKILGVFAPRRRRAMREDLPRAGHARTATATRANVPAVGAQRGRMAAEPFELAAVIWSGMGPSDSSLSGCVAALRSSNACAP